ncbi:beta-mannosidase [Planoprotostelium fungivorum]|uniref:beta-mannosidase n=1 Tax=Planoprotostelium fungivorum TaxID=1890364 RepID=A0A2P6MZU1_9EUKA|nr:beta-mannosidase [Planoprotostelium fungivorum]
MSAWATQFQHSGDEEEQSDVYTIIPSSWRLRFAGAANISKEEHHLDSGNSAAPYLRDRSRVNHRPPSHVTVNADGTSKRIELNDMDIDACVPGYIQSDLLRAGILDKGSFHEGENELEYRWVAYSNWNYLGKFQLTAKHLRYGLFLELESVDTIADIFVNGHKLGQTDNMFRKYSLNLSGKAVEGENTIEVRLTSCLDYIAEKRKNSPYPYPLWEYPNGELDRPLIRKVGCHFGWDWGPCFVPVGIPGKITVMAFERVHVDYVNIQQEILHDLQQCRLKARFGGKCVEKFRGNLEEYKMNLRIESKEDATMVYQTTSYVNVEGTGHDIILEPEALVVPLSAIQLWWPHGHGDQPLYNLRYDVREISGKIVCTGQTTFGFRRVELVRVADGEPGSLLEAADEKNHLIKEISKKGESFYLKVNGRPIFCKGGNWIPADSLSVDPLPSLLHLQSARDANFNCIRIWGGGKYESEEFYDECDRLGLIIWHDLMFACSIYPADENFLRNVREEVKWQTNRLCHHPSVALWCGNNENEDALGIWDLCKSNRDRYVCDYHNLYDLNIEPTVRRQDPSTPFWPSSPTNGSQVWGNPQEFSRGDIHYWGVWHGNQPFTAFHKVLPRFCSEFGFQSFPSMMSLRDVVRNEEDYNLTSPAMEFRQRSPAAGNKCIIDHISREFRLPNKFSSLVYQSQILQALAIKCGCEHFRRLKPYCMGEIYWQLNDIWEGPSWSSLEYSGRWKMLHYFSKKFFAPVMVSALQVQDRTEIWLTSDLPTPLRGTLFIEVWSWNGSQPSRVVQVDINAPADCSRPVWSGITKNLTANFDERENFVHFYLEGQPGVDGRCKEISSNYHSFCTMKQVRLATPHIEVKREEGNGVTLKCNSPAPFTFLETETEGHFDDNGFLLLPNRARTICFKPHGENREEIKLEVRSLMDSY